MRQPERRRHYPSSNGGQQLSARDHASPRGRQELVGGGFGWAIIGWIDEGVMIPQHMLVMDIIFFLNGDIRLLELLTDFVRIRALHQISISFIGLR